MVLLPSSTADAHGSLSSNPKSAAASEKGSGPLAVPCAISSATTSNSGRL